MCGIVGLIFEEQRDPGWVSRTLREMCQAQRMRGPDGLEVWTDGRVGLGMVRLAIVGSDLGGRQPIRDRSGAKMVFNGELYEPERTMEALGERLGQNESDGVALLRLLEVKGTAGLNDVSAMFALAKYDPKTGRVLLARDAWGQKPLYLTRIDGGWAFGSTIAALRVVVSRLELRPGAAVECLVFKSVGGMHSAFRGIEQVPPGSWVEIDVAGGVRFGKWFGSPALEDGPGEPREVAEMLEHAIRIRCTTRFPTALFLSGGLDSSIVTAVAGMQGRAQPYVLTVGYDVGGWHDEHAMASRLAAERGLRCVPVEIGVGEVPELMSAAAVALEDPIFDPVIVPTLALSRRAAENTKVVLTGDGSDEFWVGYERFADAPSTPAAYLRQTMVFHPEELGLGGLPVTYLDGVSVDRPKGMSPLDGYLRLEAANRMRNYHLARLDKITMSAGLEARSPFLDRAVTTLAQSLTAAAKCPGGRPKGLLTEAFDHVLPRWLTSRKKQPFSVPVKAWLRGGLRDFAADVLGSPNAFVRAFVDPVKCLRELDDQRADSRAAMKVWSLLHMEIWHGRFFGRMERAA